MLEGIFLMQVERLDLVLHYLTMVPQEFRLADPPSQMGTIKSQPTETVCTGTGTGFNIGAYDSFNTAYYNI